MVLVVAAGLGLAFTSASESTFVFFFFAGYLMKKAVEFKPYLQRYWNGVGAESLGEGAHVVVLIPWPPG